MLLNQIVNIPSGFIDSVNDGAPGMFTAPTMGTGVSPFSGQIGQIFAMAGKGGGNGPQVRWKTNENYGGLYQYVRLNDAAAAPVAGQIAFSMDFAVQQSDDFVDAQPSEVTTAEDNASTASALQPAGIFLTDAVTPGNYTVIQIAGIVLAKFRAALTVAGTKGCAVFCAAAGGADLGLLDVLGDNSPVLQSDWALLQPRYLGTGVVLPTNGGLTAVQLDIRRLRLF